MADDTRRPESVEALARALQKQSVESVLFNQLVADRVGINLTDLKCMSLLQLEGTLTAGRLGELAGLTGGAVTGVVDRLEKARLVERVPDPEDRRRAFLQLRRERLAEVTPLFGALTDAIADVASEFSEADLKTILEFIQRTTAAQQLLRTELRERSGVMAADVEEFSAPLGRLAAGRLEFPRGAWALLVSGDTNLPVLYEARFSGPSPIMRSGPERGLVSVQYRWPSLMEAARLMVPSRKLTGHLTLNGVIPWDLELRRGVARVNFELSLVSLRSLRIQGGVTDVEVALPEPEGTVEVQIEGGVSNLEFSRPAQVPVRLRVSGGVAGLRFDRRLQRPAEQCESLSPGYATARNRYDVRIGGGASNLTFGYG